MSLDADHSAASLLRPFHGLSVGDAYGHAAHSFSTAYILEGDFEPAQRRAQRAHANMGRRCMPYLRQVLIGIRTSNCCNTGLGNAGRGFLAYSYRNAVMGSTRVARRAGISAATVATTARVNSTPEMVTLSSSVTPYSSPASRRPVTTAAARPAQSPPATGRKCPPQDDFQDVCPAGSEGHTNAHFAGAASHQIQDDAMDSKASSHQGSKRKQQAQSHLKTTLPNGFVNDLLHDLESRNGQL